MEVLYSKLYDKYSKLKTKKLSDLDHVNKEQEVKFLNCLSAAEEVIEHLRSQNDELLERVNELKADLASLRATKHTQVADYQRLLIEEREKNCLHYFVPSTTTKPFPTNWGRLHGHHRVLLGIYLPERKSDEVLSEEIEKLLKFRQEGTSRDLTDNSKIISADNQIKDNSNSSSLRTTRKRTRLNALEKEARVISSENGEGNSIERESTQNTCRETASSELPKCCTKTNDQSGIDLQGSDHDGNWLIRVLFENAMGMKLSTDYQNGRTYLSALHESSGYSFSLTWIKKSPGEEAELLYHVISLGTFERVAAEWMREDIMFSPSMCPIFFERVSHVLKLNC